MKTNLLKTNGLPDLCETPKTIECDSIGELFNSLSGNSVRVCLLAGEVAQVTAFKLATGNTIKVFIDAKGGGVDCADCGPNDRVPYAPCKDCSQKQLSDTRRQEYVVGPNCFVFVSDAPAGEPFVKMVKFRAEDVPESFLCPEECVAAPPAPVPVTATVSPCPVPSCFTWGGTEYNSIASFVNDIKAIVSGATYNPVTCTFTAPEGSVFPDLTVVACVPVVPEPVYCPSFRIDGSCESGCMESGFMYRDGDVKDPAATVQITACDGSIAGWIYPTAAPTHTIPYYDGGATIVGYLANKSECAPEVSPVINNYVTTNVAAPVVNNAFSPTTNVAAPNVVLPAPNVVALQVSPAGVVTATLDTGAQVVSNEPSSPC